MKKYVRIDGIHCDDCKRKIKKALLENKDIYSVKIKDSVAVLDVSSNLDNKDIIKIINNLGYVTKNKYITTDKNNINTKIKLYEFLFIVVVILSINFILNKTLGFNILNFIPNIDSNVTYGMLFVIGMLCSVHCVGMCGAINLIAVYSEKRDLKKPLLYNLGRLISYTLIGGVVGLFGSVIKINDTVNGIIIILSSIVMCLLSLKMLGIIDFKYIHFKGIKSTNSFVIGLLNGFMPCGVLQAMEIYALNTGSFFKGALSMFLFCLGTIPLMLCIGFLFNILKGRWNNIINKISSVLILILSLSMFNRGLLYFNIDLFKNNDYKGYQASIIKNNIQVVEFDLSYNNYKDILVQKDIPVKVIINVDEEYLTGCNNEVYIDEFGIKKKLKVGKNIIKFTPKKTGVYTYTCFMNMIKNNIKVIDNKRYFKEAK